MARILMIALDATILSRAARVGPVDIRSLDAIHLATAMSVPVVNSMVVYDRRLAGAAEAAGLRVWAPGQAGT